MRRNYRRIREVEVVDNNKVQVKQVGIETMGSFELKQEIERSYRALAAIREEVSLLQEEYREEKEYISELEEVLTNLETKTDDYDDESIFELD